jgi:zinc protease
MKRSIFVLFAILSAGIFLAKTTFAADDRPAADQLKPAAAAKKPARPRLHVEFGPDGRISKEKFLADNPTDDPKLKAALEKLFKRLDANHDGFITVPEMKAAAQRARDAAGPSGPTAPDDEPAADPKMPSVPPDAAKDGTDCNFAVVISDVSAAKPEWKAVADALVKKRNGKLVVYKGSVVNCLPELAKLHPKYTAFVARPEIVGRQFVARIHRLTRHLGDEPYTGTIWGIVSGATPEAALRVATATGPEVVHSVISNTGVINELYDTVFTLSDGQKGNWYSKDAAGKEAQGSDGDADRTQLFVDKFKGIKPDAIVTSGHATEANLEMPFSMGNTEARDGKWCGIVNWRRPDAEESVVAIPQDDHPRVFLGAGNCLIGNFHKSPKSMAATLISNYNVNQFVGYIVPTWYGKGGWGTLGLWQHLGGRYSLAEAWFFNNQVITHELKTRFPKSAGRNLPVTEVGEGLDEQLLASSGVSDKDEAGMLWDRDVVAFYGDPALRVTVDPGKLTIGVDTKLSQNGDVYTLEVEIAKKTAGVSKDQPLAMLFPKRIPGKITVVSGQEYEPVITSHFIMLTKPKYTADSSYKVEFKAEP